MSSYLQIHLDLESEDDSLLLGFEVVNTSRQSLHILDDDALPYRILLPNGDLRILHGLPELAVGEDIASQLLPLTQELAPGDSLAGMVSLQPLFLNTVGRPGVLPKSMKGAIQVQFEMGFGLSPIRRADRSKMTYGQFLQWQQLVPAKALSVKFS